MITLIEPVLARKETFVKRLSMISNGIWSIFEQAKLGFNAQVNLLFLSSALARPSPSRALYLQWVKVYDNSYATSS